VYGLTQRVFEKSHRSDTIDGWGSPPTLMTKLVARRRRATKRTKGRQYKLDLLLTLAAKQTASLIAIHATHRKKQRQQASPDISRHGKNLHASPASQQGASKRCPIP
jgi:hypothetical protein